MIRDLIRDSDEMTFGRKLYHGRGNLSIIHLPHQYQTGLRDERDCDKDGRGPETRSVVIGLVPLLHDHRSLGYVLPFAEIKWMIADKP